MTKNNHLKKLPVDKANPALRAEELNIIKGLCAQHFDEDFMYNTLVLTITPWGSDTLYSHLTVEKTKAEKPVNFPRSHSWQECGPVGFETSLLHDKFVCGIRQNWECDLPPNTSYAILGMSQPSEPQFPVLVK